MADDTASEGPGAAKSRFPPWIRKRIPAGNGVSSVQGMLRQLGLATVCASAHCPNLHECFHRGTATFLIMGSVCTRACWFCAIEQADPGPLREDEPKAVAEACARLGLRHVVITSVTRDDLPDGGAAHYVRTIQAVRARLPGTVIEVLVPDFQGSTEAIATVLDAQPEIFNHNVETVPRLYQEVRPAADYGRSLDVLGQARRLAGEKGLDLWTKSGLMVGLGETAGEIRAVLHDLRAAGCDIVTIGQYLAPSAEHAPVARFVKPAEFAAWETEARTMGFAAVASAPFVRSSYHADQVFERRERG